MALVQALNFNPCTWVVLCSVKVKEYVTPVALGTPEDIVSERNVSCPIASAFGNKKGTDQEVTMTKTTSSGTIPMIGFHIHCFSFNT
jgi:hypothetical protein